MGKWWMPDNGTAAVGIHDEDGKWLSDAAYRSHADALIVAHNADCDAYESTIADLEEERDAAVEFAHTVEREFAAANATMDALREAIRRQHAELFYVTAAQYLRVGFDAKKETDNG